MVSIVCRICSGRILNQENKLQIKDKSGNVTENGFPDLADTLHQLDI